MSFAVKKAANRLGKLPKVGEKIENMLAVRTRQQRTLSRR
jgi:hypothetical protein